MLQINDLARFLELAQDAARQAGAYLQQQQGHATIQSSKSRRDDLLNVDIEAENILLTHLHQATPDFGTLSEEAGFEGSKQIYWIIDPLDGSANFQHGNPLFSVAIALVENQQTMGSVIYLPTLNEVFTAIKGKGAYLNQCPIHVSQTAQLIDAIVHFGDFTKEDDLEASQAGLRDFSQVVLQVRRIRMMGSAAADLAYLACGRADALLNHATSPWDIEAGKLLVEEAGGLVSSFPQAKQKPLFLYSNKVLHANIQEVIQNKAIKDK